MPNVARLSAILALSIAGAVSACAAVEPRQLDDGALAPAEDSSTPVGQGQTDQGRAPNAEAVEPHDSANQEQHHDAEAVSFTVERFDGWPFVVTLSNLEPMLEFGIDVSQSPPGRARVVGSSRESLRATVTPAATDRETPNAEGYAIIEYSWAAEEFDSEIMRQSIHVPPDSKKLSCQKRGFTLTCRLSTSTRGLGGSDEPSAFAEWPEDAALAVAEWLASTEPDVAVRLGWWGELEPAQDAHGCHFEQGTDGALDFGRALGSCRILP
jgi:hypothetical protein